MPTGVIRWGGLCWEFLRLNAQAHIVEEVEYLGEAGNPRYPPKDQVRARRTGNRVAIVWRGRVVKRPKADETVVEGFGSLDGRTLAAIMKKEGFWYNHALGRGREVPCLHHQFARQSRRARRTRRTND